jgi:hypothetical protein
MSDGKKWWDLMDFGLKAGLKQKWKLLLHLYLDTINATRNLTMTSNHNTWILREKRIVILMWKALQFCGGIRSSSIAVPVDVMAIHRLSADIPILD